MLAALVAATKFKRNHESAFLVTASLHVGSRTPVAAPQRTTLRWAAPRLTPRHCACPADPAHQAAGRVSDQQHTTGFLSLVLGPQPLRIKAWRVVGPQTAAQNTATIPPAMVLSGGMTLKVSLAIRFNRQN